LEASGYSAGENSFAMLTINADNHPLFGLMQQVGEEKRMPVLLSEADYGAWLDASPEKSMEFMRQFPAEVLAMTPDPLPSADPKSTRKKART
jgi:putative SOS response-associated peptidase YedK